MEKVIVSIIGFSAGVLIATVLILRNNVADLESRIDKVERVNEVQNGVIVEFLHSN